MTLITISFYVMTACALLALLLNRRLMRLLREAQGLNEDLRRANKDLSKSANAWSKKFDDVDLERRKLKTLAHTQQDEYDAACDALYSYCQKAYIRETGYNVIFVARKGYKGNELVIKQYPYNPTDPADHDYMRICAEELVETLNADHRLEVLPEAESIPSQHSAEAASPKEKTPQDATRSSFPVSRS